MPDPQYSRLSFTMDDGVAIVADAWGDPAHPPVLFAHGGGQTRHSWGNSATEVAQRGWYAIAYDHRGHGDSGWSPNGAYPIERFAADQRAIARQLPRPPVLVGASLGGLSAMLAQGELDPAVFTAVVLVDITPRMNPAGARNIIGFMREHVAEGFASLQEAADIIADYTGRPRQRNLEGLRKNLREGEDGRYYWHWDPNFVRARGDAVGNPDRLLQATRNIRAPMLLVRGRMSDLVTEELAREFLELVPGAQYVDVENARHMVAGDRNDIFTRAVVDFLDGLPGTGP